MKSWKKSKRPHTCALGTFIQSDLSNLSTICDNDSETRSSAIKMKTYQKQEIAKTRYGKDMRTNDIVRLKLLEGIKNKENSALSMASAKSVVHYRLIKHDFAENQLAPLKPKWCELEKDEETSVQKKSERKISVIYKCPELKQHLQRYMDVIANKIKWSKRLVYSYIISQISPERIEVKSEVPITSLGPYLKILENPNLPLWEQLCRTVQLDTGHSVGDIVVNIHLIK